MLNPTGNLQQWLDNNRSQVRSESYIEFEIYWNEPAYRSIVLYKKDIINFKYKTSGKVDNSELFSRELTFEIEKQKNIDIPLGAIIIARVGFQLGGYGRYVVLGQLELKEKEQKANGITDKYTFKNKGWYANEVLSPFNHFGYKQLTDTYHGGSNKYLPADKTLPTEMVDMELGDLYYNAFKRLGNGLISINFPVGKGLGEVSYEELAQLIAIASGQTYKINSNSGVPDFVEIDLTTSNVDYVIDNFLMYEFAEFSKEKEYYAINANLYTTSIGGFEFALNKSYSVPSNTTISFLLDKTLYQTNFLYIVKQATDKLYYGGNEIVAINKSASTMTFVLYNLKYIETASDTKVVVISPNGDNDNVFKVDNPLMTENHWIRARAYLERWLPFQEYINCNFRYDPRLEVFDKVVIYDKNNLRYYAIVEEIDMSYEGSYSAKIKARIFKKDYYNIRFWNYNGSVLQQEYINSGETPVYKGATPTRPSTALNDYVFKGWSPAIYAVDKDQIYTAEYDAISKQAKLEVRNIEINDSTNWSFDIYNPKNEDVDITIMYSSSDNPIHATIEARSSMTFSSDDYSNLDQSIEAYINGELEDTIYCYYDDYEELGNTIILEAQI